MLSKNQIKLIKSLSQKKFRNQHSLFTVEGPKGIFEFLNSNFKCHAIYTISKDLFPSNEVIEISEKELKQLSQLKSPNAAVGVFYMPSQTAPKREGLILALDSINDPGNLGTIIRLCDWFGVAQLICSKDTVDCFNSKVVQATMGSLSRVNIAYMDLKEYLKSYPHKIYGTFMNGTSIYKEQFSSDGLVIMGNEANGISPEIEAFIVKRIAIPKYGNQKETESLNVATASAICLAHIKQFTTEM